MKKEEIHKTVREHYGGIARAEGSCSCCGPDTTSTYNSCCSTATGLPKSIGKKIGYSEEELDQVPEGANLGLGCGNPVALASLREGDIVLDLGSGAGFDCFLAAAKVGAKGKVIGIDMTPEMLDRARDNARKGNYENVEFRLGEIENLPVADKSVDVVISNCVINLSENKQRVFEEAYRALKPGGRLMVSDIVLLKELPGDIRSSISAYVGCVAGALKKNSYLEVIRKSGFDEVNIVEETVFPLDCFINNPADSSFTDELGVTPQKMKEFSDSIWSIRVSAVKPSEVK
ncbi:arsenite methyltransferase [Chloroflexota bacterium]